MADHRWKKKPSHYTSMDAGTVDQQIAKWQIVIKSKGFGKLKNMARRKIAELENEKGIDGMSETKAPTVPAAAARNQAAAVARREAEAAARKDAGTRS